MMLSVFQDAVHKFTRLEKYTLTFVPSLERFRTDERLSDLCYFL